MKQIIKQICIGYQRFAPGDYRGSIGSIIETTYDDGSKSYSLFYTDVHGLANVAPETTEKPRIDIPQG